MKLFLSFRCILGGIGMRINSLIAFLSSLIVGVMVFFILGSKFTGYLIIPLVLIGIFLAIFIFYKKIPFANKLPFKISLSVLSAVVYLALGAFILIYAINYPPEENFEEKLELAVCTEEEYKNGEELFVLFNEFNDLFNSLNIEVEEDELDSYAVEFLENTAAKRESISKFIKSKDIAISTRPAIELEDNSFSEQDIQKYVDAIVNFISLELVEVKTLQNQGKTSEAASKYIDLWNTVDAIISIKNTNVYYAMLYSYIVTQMGEYYYNNQEEFKEYNFSRISSITENILEKLDKAYENLIVADYYIIKNNKSEVSQFFKWPFFDLNATMRKYHSYFYSMIEWLNRPYDETITYEEPLEKVNVFDRNPFGEIQYAEEIKKFEIALFDQVIKNYINKKTEIGVYMYAINYKRNSENIPKDYKTGGEVQIKDYDDAVEIFTGGIDSREKKFQILK